MNTERPSVSVAIENIETLLSTRPRSASSVCDKALESLAEVISGMADEKTAGEVDRHLMACPACREILTTLHFADAKPPASPAKRRAILDSPKRYLRPLLKPLSLSAAALFIGALSMFLFMVDRAPRHEEDQLALKGYGDNLIVAVERDGKVFTADYLDTLKTGDHLGLFYTAALPGYLAVLSRDATGDTAVLYPSGTAVSVPIQAGEKRSLPDGAVVDEGNRCEWIVAVFSDAPLSLEGLRHIVANAKSTGAQCGLSFDIPKARTVNTLPFLR